MNAAAASNDVLHRYALYLGDTSLILAQRLSEWVGHGPEIEEDLALANISLDLLGQARYLLSFAGEVEGRNRGEDELAFLRDPLDFTNLMLVEQPNGDFGCTIVRQVLVDAWQLELYERLQSSPATRLAELAAKALKETRYHLRFSSGWLIRLGDGTQESHERVQAALDTLWRYTDEMFVASAAEQDAVNAGIAPDPASLKAPWLARIEPILKEATLAKPASIHYPWLGKRGQHSEHLGHLLAPMQYLQRTYPGARW